MDGTLSSIKGLTVFLTIVTLVMSIVVLVGNIVPSYPLSNLYLLRMYTADLIVRPKPLKDWYTVGLWNYCWGRSGSSGPDHCTHTHAAFQFNPLKVFGFNTADGEAFLKPHSVRNGTAPGASPDTYRWLLAAYIATAASTVATLFLGRSVIPDNPRGIVMPTITTAITTGFAVGGAATAQVVFSKLADYINHDMLRRTTEIGRLRASLGTTEFIIAWVGAGAAAASFVCSLLLLSLQSRRRKRGSSRVPTPEKPRPEHPESQQPPRPSPSESSLPMEREPYSWEKNAFSEDPMDKSAGRIYPARTADPGVY